MKILNATQTEAALPYPALIQSLEAIFKVGVSAPLRHHHNLSKQNEADSTLLLMPVWNQQYGCIKIVNVTPDNAQRGLPAVSASVLLFDNTTGQHIALLDGATVTARRTAAAAALGAKHLAREDAETLLIVGAGRIGAELTDAFSAVRPIQRILVWNKTPTRGEQLVTSLQARGLDAQWQPDLAAGVKQADIISCATLTNEPLIRGEWLQPGQHLDLIGAFTPTMREADNLAMQRSQLYVDTEGAIVEAGEIILPLQQGAIQREDILGTLYELCAKPIVRDTQAITCFKGAGNAVMDLAAAMLAHRGDGISG